MPEKTVFLFVCLFFVFLLFLWAAPAAYGGSQARGPIGAVATGLHQSHSNAGSEPRLQPTLQLTETPDRQPTEQGQGPNPQPHGSTAPQRELQDFFKFQKHRPPRGGWDKVVGMMLVNKTIFRSSRRGAVVNESD